MDEKTPGLGTLPKSDWPKLKRFQHIKDLCKPNSTSHSNLLDYFFQRLKFSEGKMEQFHNRWRIAEIKSQSYVTLQDYEKNLKQLNQDKGAPPKAVSLIVPLTHAINSTIVTYLLQVFAGRRPIFPVVNNKDTEADRAQMVEQVLQYNADHSRFIKQLFMFLNDGQTYGMSAFRILWERTERKRTRRGMTPDGIEISTRNLEVVYEGNNIESLDPFMFYPDPRVPMMDVAKKGEFVYWRNFVGKHWLKKMEAANEMFFIDDVNRQLPRTAGFLADRKRISEGDATAGLDQGETHVPFYYQLDQGTCEIIPRELGLGESELPEKWLVGMANESQIVQLAPFDADHDMHPVAVSEPYPVGYGFGHPSMADYIGPIQDLVSWFLNSRVANVRTTLNNMWVVDPLRVELTDLNKSGEGKIIRLKAPILGQDMRSAIQQLPIQDVTTGHVQDVQNLVRMAQMLAAVNDNTMGIQEQGGRKTATEVRTALEAGASRLSALARVISAQALVDLREMMVVNLQQYQSQEFWVNVLGQDGVAKPINVQPHMLVGDFNYPVHDGTMPLDKVALLDVWKEIFMATGQDPDLSGTYNRAKIFEYMAELGGARNIEAMKFTQDEMVQRALGQGQLQGVGPATLPAALAGASPNVNAMGGARPMTRMLNGAGASGQQLIGQQRAAGQSNA